MKLDELITLTDTLAAELVPPPDDAPDICPICRGWRNQEARCWNCLQVALDLPRPSEQVFPISLYRKPSQLRDWVTFYKSERGEERAEYGTYLGAILGRFFFEQDSALREAVDGYDVICVVPSGGRLPPHPLTRLVAEFVTPYSSPTVELLERGPGELGHTVTSHDAFVVRASVQGMRIVLVDDVFTSGATAQSAASALQVAGAIVPAIIVGARRLNPDFHPALAAIWERQSSKPFSFAEMPFWRQ